MDDVLLAFGCGVAIDFAYVFWIRACATGRRAIAGCASVAVAAPSLMGYIQVIDDRWLAGPYLAGLFTGTIAAMTLFPEEKHGDENV